MASRNVRIIHLSVLEQNMRKIRSSVPAHVHVMAVVKADGYGHGACETARAALAGGADMLAVASADEGVQLRNDGFTEPILVLGAVTGDDVLDGTAHGLIQTVCTPEMAELCEKAAVKTNRCSEVHIKIDTGMGRIGIRTEAERDALLETLKRCPHVRVTGAFTHFADADGGEEGIRYTREQFRRFLEMTESLPQGILRHCCNSAAIHRFPEMALDMVRAGISLYGYPPVENDLDLQPCMDWVARVSHVKTVPAGTCISYGRTYRSATEVRVATVTCGYGDGYHRTSGSLGYVLIHGRKAKIIGRVCMDQMMVDVSGLDSVQPGDEVILMGKSGEETITAEDLASWCGTISYEILLSSGLRVERRYC